MNPVDAPDDPGTPTPPTTASPPEDPENPPLPGPPEPDLVADAALDLILNPPPVDNGFGTMGVGTKIVVDIHPWTENGLARRINDVAAGRWMRHDKKWWTYVAEGHLGGTWVVREEDEIEGFILRFVTTLYEREKDLYGDEDAYENGKPVPDSAPRKKFRKWCAAVTTTKMIRNAKAQCGMMAARTEVEWDGTEKQKTRFYCVANGVLDRDTGELGDWDPAFMHRRKMNAEYHPERGYSDWEHVLSVLITDKKHRRCLQTTAGTAMFVPRNPRKLAPFLLGDRDSGKTSVCAALRHTCGSYAIASSLSVLRGTYGGGQRQDVVRLHDKRLVIFSEPSSDWELHGDMFKRMTGGDEPAVRGFNSSVFTEGAPDFMSFTNANEMPSIKGIDEAAKSRLLAFTFDGSGLATGVDAETLKTGAYTSQILNWMLDGYRWGLLDGIWERIRDTLARPTDEAVTGISWAFAFLADKEWVSPEAEAQETPLDVMRAGRTWRRERGFAGHSASEPTGRQLLLQLNRAGWKASPPRLNEGTMTRMRQGFRLRRHGIQLPEDLW